MKYTQNYNLKKPEDTDPADIQDLNDNADAIDGKLKEIEDKANTAAGAALQAANDYTDQKVGETKGLIGTLSQLVTTAKTNIVAAVNEIFGKVEDVEDELAAHKAENMPHQFINHKENKTYKFGFQVSVDGKPQIIYEEVV